MVAHIGRDIAHPQAPIRVAIVAMGAPGPAQRQTNAYVVVSVGLENLFRSLVGVIVQREQKVAVRINVVISQRDCFLKTLDRPVQIAQLEPRGTQVVEHIRDSQGNSAKALVKLVIAALNSRVSFCVVPR